MKFIMLINVKIPFMSMINAAFDSLQQSDMLFQKQSNRGLHRLSMAFWQATSVRYFRTFTAYCSTRQLID